MRKLFAFAVLVVSVAVPAAATAAPRPVLTVKSSAIKVLYGNSVMLSGRLTRKPAGTKVEVLAWRYGASSPVTVGHVRIAAGGRFSYRARPSVQTIYKVRDATLVSHGVTVHVAPALSLRELGDGRIWAHVAISKSLKGREVQLQQLRGRTWTTIEKATLTKTSSSTFAALPASPSGPVRLALSVNEAGNGYLGALSHSLVYHAYTLTLTPSSFKVLYGHSIMLGGRLWNGRSGEKIVLEAWPYGRSSPVRTATVTTTANGRWSYRVTPRTRTAYQATWTSQHISARQTVGVAPAIAVRQLAGHRISAQVRAGVSLAGRTIQLQRRLASGAWKTVDRKPLGSGSRVTFTVSLPVSTLRVALSVNQAGAGLLGGASRSLHYRP